MKTFNQEELVAFVKKQRQIVDILPGETPIELAVKIGRLEVLNVLMDLILAAV